MNYASWGKRFLATIVDMLIIAPFYIIAIVVGKDSTAVFFIVWLLGVGVAVYNRWIQAGKTGQTWGRKVLGIKLVGEASGAPIGAGNAFVRDLCHIVDSIICYIGWLFPLWDAKRQTIADKIVKTVVVAA